MRILVVGAGATGGYFGGRLAEAGRDVTFLLRPARATQIRRDGLQIISPHGNAAVRPHVVTKDGIGGTYDVVLLTVKAYALDGALDDLAPAVGADTMIVPVLNGLRHIDVLIRRFGEKPVLGGVCLVATTLDPEGRIRQLAEFQELIYGERSGAGSTRIEALDREMQGVGFKARASDTILLEMWRKWILLATLGGITCLMRGTVGEIEAAPDGADFALRFLAEIVAVATAAGYKPGEDFLVRTRATVTAPGSAQVPSMYRDLQQGLPVEVDQIIGDMLARARRLGVPTPLLALAFTHLKIYQDRISAR